MVNGWPLTCNHVAKGTLALNFTNSENIYEKYKTCPHSAFINRIVQCEMVWVLERAYQYNREQIAHALDMVFRTRQFQVEDRQAALSALRHFRQGKRELIKYPQVQYKL